MWLSELRGETVLYWHGLKGVIKEKLVCAVSLKKKTFFFNSFTKMRRNLPGAEIDCGVGKEGKEGRINGFKVPKDHHSIRLFECPKK